MDYKRTTPWIVVKRFLFGWVIAAGILVIISCVKYREFIVAAFVKNAWAWINAILPIVIMILAIGYLLKLLFK